MKLKIKTLLISAMLFVSACGTQPETNQSAHLYGYGISKVVKNILLSKNLIFHDSMENNIHDSYRRYHFAIMPITSKLTTTDPTVREKLPIIHEILEKALLDSEKVEVYNLKSNYWDYNLECSLTTPKDKVKTINIPNNYLLECIINNRKENNS